jgi:hypothetical protein
MRGVAPQHLVAGQNCLVGTAKLKQDIGAIGQCRQKTRPDF